MNTSRDWYVIYKIEPLSKTKNYRYEQKVHEYYGSVNEIADYLGVSKTWVYYCIHHNNLIKGYHIGAKAKGRNVSTKYKVYDGDELIDRGTGKEIAERFNVSVYTVRNACSRKGKMLCRYTIVKEPEHWKTVRDSVLKSLEERNKDVVEYTER